jgi:hypothetical protein
MFKWPLMPNNRAQMNDLIVVERIAGWEKQKALVLDSVSSPITKRVYNMALNEFLAWVSTGAAARRGLDLPSDRERMEGIAGRTPARLVVDHHPHVADSQGGCGGLP